jgi:hypothetical protein
MNSLSEPIHLNKWLSKEMRKLHQVECDATNHQTTIANSVTNVEKIKRIELKIV